MPGCAGIKRSSCANTFTAVRKNALPRERGSEAGKGGRETIDGLCVGSRRETSIEFVG